MSASPGTQATAPRSPVVVGGLVALAVICVVLTVGAGTSITSVGAWSGLSAGFVGFAAAIAVVIRGGEVLTARTSWSAAALVVAATGISWAFLPPSTFTAWQCAPAVVAGVVVMSLLAMRGAQVQAWLAMITTTLVAGVCGIHLGIGFVGGAVLTSRGYPVLILATLFRSMVQPMEKRSRELRRRAIADAEAAAAAEAVATERARQLARLDATARPILERIVSGRELSVSEVNAARLVEAGLRDAIRAEGWTSDAVGDAVRQARRDGIVVRLFDDGALADQPELCVRLQDLLVAELDALDVGQVTARIMPAGRTVVASIVVDTGALTRRHECAADGRISVSEVRR